MISYVSTAATIKHTFLYFAEKEGFNYTCCCAADALVKFMWRNFPSEYPAGKTVLACQKVRRVNIYLTNLSFTIYPMGQVGMLQNFNWQFHFFTKGFAMKSISEWNENWYRAWSKRTCQFITQTKATLLTLFTNLTYHPSQIKSPSHN